MIKTEKRKIIFLILSFLLVIEIILAVQIISAGGPYPGTCDGYVHNTEGDIIDSATVIATVSSCSLDCVQQTTTESSQYHTGYYVVANLPLSKFGAINVYAEKFNTLYNRMEFGSTNGLANEFHAARVNVIICLPPDPPILVDQPSTHSTSVNLKWTSFPDFKGYFTYDDFQIDSGPIIKSNNDGNKNQDVIGLSFSLHTWRVRSCNNYCCSVWVSDSFNVGNLPPSAPNLTDQLDTNPGTVSLSWISGTDPDGDETYDDYEFGIIKSDRKNVTDAISPQTEQVFSCNYYLWKVRTCEKESQHLCSAWVDDGFISCGIQCPTCTGGEIWRDQDCQIFSKQPYSLFMISPSIIEEEEELPLKISFYSSGSAGNIVFKANSSGFNFNDFMISKVENKKATFNISGKLKEGKSAGLYDVNFDVFVGAGKAFSESFVIRVKEPLLIKIKRLAREIPRKFGWWIFILILVIISSAFIMFYMKYFKKKNPIDFFKEIFGKNKKNEIFDKGKTNSKFKQRI